jgi:hypothetical protein
MSSIQEEINKLKAEIKSLPHISLYDEDGEINDDAYQERLEQQEYKAELQFQIDELEERLIEEQTYLTP